MQKMLKKEQLVLWIELNWIEFCPQEWLLFQWFHSIALRILSAPSFFAWLVRAPARALSELGRFSMKTELFREINERFLLIEHGDPYFLLYKLNQDSVLKAK